MAGLPAVAATDLTFGLLLVAAVLVALAQQTLP